ncbi:chromosome partitioning ATPase [Novosphingobium marinum]|uniref:Mrp family chromosome partitioning ATPase n=1 Tax=Novosphingobium marinum TaxID=1514948 RepID=A0A7Y9XVT5_9SPHN|nr:AAA family ATPase [Novosphingobium marinum]NYH94078.1 Mrp family chromosome partitioning ATPase [Novosphingobium marinum]GGC19430.1 chromosome partitioning ATPase [Novosphingobium marinum]
MTKQSKIPVPPEGEKAERAAETLIERAVGRYDLNRLAPSPVPQALAPARPKPAMRHRAPETPEAPLEEPAVVTEPVKATPPAPVVEPVRFTGEAHAIDREHLRAQGLIVPEGIVTGLMEEFRIVKRQLLAQSADLRRQSKGAAAQRILVCSPHPGEGKTYCSVNLALAMAAEKESDVLLVDADFAKPSILSALGLPGGPGLMDALIDGEADVADFVLNTDVPGLHVLPAGNGTNSDSEYLSSSRTGKVLERLTQGAPNRMVIFDSPPALAASPAAELAKYVGQSVVVVRADRTGQGALEDAISLLSACPNIELLLNAVNFSPSGRRFGSYYGYGG